jgi:hypothetical protein
MGGINAAVRQRWAVTGEVDPDDVAQFAVTLFFNGVRSRSATT